MSSRFIQVYGCRDCPYRKYDDEGNDVCEITGNRVAYHSAEFPK